MRQTGDFIAASEAAKLLGTSRRWVYELVKQGRVRSMLTGGIRLVSRDDIMELRGVRAAGKG